ncbi:hypothetical protein C8Q74DRAFT_1039653 [Fomes fomentarius]|nr:hypothetical protein C8Q74DRAFT_1039653 [Fomes fomentarius]
MQTISEQSQQDPNVLMHGPDRSNDRSTVSLLEHMSMKAGAEDRGRVYSQVVQTVAQIGGRTVVSEYVYCPKCFNQYGSWAELNQHYTFKHTFSLRAEANNHLPRFYCSPCGQFVVDDKHSCVDTTKSLKSFVTEDIEGYEGEAPANHGNSEQVVETTGEDADKSLEHTPLVHIAQPIGIPVQPSDPQGYVVVNVNVNSPLVDSGNGTVTDSGHFETVGLVHPTGSNVVVSEEPVMEPSSLALQKPLGECETYADQIIRPESKDAHIPAPRGQRAKRLARKLLKAEQAARAQEAEQAAREAEREQEEVERAAREREEAEQAARDQEDAAQAAMNAEADSALAQDSMKEQAMKEQLAREQAVKEAAAKQGELGVPAEADSNAAAAAAAAQVVSVPEAAETGARQGRGEVVRTWMTLTEEQKARRAKKKAKQKAMQEAKETALRAALREPAEVAETHANDPCVPGTGTGTRLVGRETATVTPNSDESTCNIATQRSGWVLGAVDIDELTQLKKEIQDLKEAHESQADRILTKITGLEGKLRTASLQLAKEGRDSSSTHTVHEAQGLVLDGAIGGGSASKNTAATDSSDVTSPEAGLPKAQLVDFHPGTISDEQLHHILLHRYGQELAGQLQDLLDKVHKPVLNAPISVANAAGDSERNASVASGSAPRPATQRLVRAVDARTSTAENLSAEEQWEDALVEEFEFEDDSQLNDRHTSAS